MEQFLFRKIGLWVVLLVFCLGLIGMVSFGAAVLDSERKTARFGQLSAAAVAIAEIPDTVKRMLGPDTRLTVHNPDRFDDRPTGWTLAQGMPAAALQGYLLVSRYDGDRKRNVIELLSLADWKVAHRWIPEASELLADAARSSAFGDYSTWSSQYFRGIHPILTEDGGLIFKDHFSPLFRVDACARRVWMNDGRMFHHSTELDADGNFWIPALVEPHSIKRVREDFFEDQIVKVGPGGEVLFEKSVAQMLLDAGLDWMIFANGEYRFDPMHLNDIEPALTDGPYWKKGDLFLSLRNISTIVQYRPSTDKIVWLKSGPWMAQHDVDILDDRRIAVFDNNAQMRGGETFVEGSSEVMVYDFSTSEIESPLLQPMRENKIKTLFAGFYTALPGSYSLVEDSTDARLMIFDRSGSVAAEFVNRAEDGRIYHLGWTRFVEKNLGDRALSSIKLETCDG